MEKIIIIIPTCRRSKLLKRTLDSLQLCTLPEIPVSAFVVENGDKHNAEEVGSQSSSGIKINYRYHEKANKSSALNSVLPECADSFLIFLDDDVRCSPDLLVKFYEAFKLHGEGCFYGGAMGVDYETPPPEWLKEYLPPSAVGFAYRADPEKVLEPVFQGCNWALHSSLLEKIGGFNPNYGPGSATGSTGQESQAMGACIKNGHHGIYVPLAKVWHYVPENRCSQEWLLDRAYKNGVQFGQSQEWEGPHWFSVPRWMHRRRIILKLKSIIASFSGNEKKTFQQKYEYQFLKGQIKGAFLRHKEILS